jgi:membrane fusion protein (multidrug efflux system)
MFPPENAAGSFVKVVQRIPVKIVFDGQPNEKYDLSIGMSVVTAIKVR